MEQYGTATPGSGSPQLREIRAHYNRIKAQFAARDGRMQDVLAVRQGRMRDVYPDLFPEGPFDKGIVANMVDVAARDLAETLAPMPSFNCTSARMVSDTAREFAEKRTRIVNGYINFSNVQTQMYTATDRYFTYGFVPAMIEIDMEQQMPRITFMDSIGAYPVFDRWGNTKAGYFSFYKNRDELIAMYPHVEEVIQQQSTGLEMIEVVRYHDAKIDVIFCPTRDGIVLEKIKNPIGECLLEFVRRPGVDTETHGQFDDVLAVQVAKARFALLSLEAAQKSVQAPIVLPPDAQELALGSDAVIRTASGEKVRRVPIEVPASAFAQQGVLDQELRQGSRYPEVRGGNSDASVITGKGVQALMSGFDTQIRTGQAMFAKALENLVGKAFMVDEKLFGAETKILRGNTDGAPYEIKYRPDRDIKGDYSVDVQYGLLAGLDPNRALVFGLQARGDQLISRDFLRRQMPFALDASEESMKVDTENLRDSMLQAVSGLAQSIPALAAQGQDVSEVLKQLSIVITARQKGTPIEKAIEQAFMPPEPEPAPPELAEEAGMEADMLTGSPDDMMQSGGDGLPGGLRESGRMRDVAPGQQGMPEGGRPDLMSLMASMGSKGKPNLQAAVQRKQAI